MTRKEVAEMIYRLIYEEVSFVLAMVDATCMTNGFLDETDPESMGIIQQSFEDYGLSSDSDSVLALMEKYGENEEVLGAIGTGILETCPEAAENL